VVVDLKPAERESYSIKPENGLFRFSSVFINLAAGSIRLDFCTTGYPVFSLS
jgi:hypothetical protein